MWTASYKSQIFANDYFSGHRYLQLCLFIVLAKNFIDFYNSKFLFLIGHSYHDGLNLPQSPKRRGRSRTRGPIGGGIRPPLLPQRSADDATTSRSNSRDPLYRTTSLETRSHSPSPTSTPTTVHNIHEYYGTANLTDRSRSPSPSTRLRLAAASKSKQHSGRRLPATPNKPSTLFLGNPVQPVDNNMPHVIPSPTVPQPQKSPGSINFPHLNASPTHLPGKAVPNPPPVLGVNLTAGGVPSHALLVSPSANRSDFNLVSQLPGPQKPAPARELPSTRELPLTRELPSNRYAPSMVPLLNNGRPDPRFSMDRIDDGSTNRFIDNAISTSGTLPNGFKPGQTIHRHRTGGEMSPLHRRKNPTAQATSDSDDDEWC